MPLALPFDGVAPLFLHVVLDPFELWDASVQRKVLVESLELDREVPSSRILRSSTCVSRRACGAEAMMVHWCGGV
jgi:hypothetical protein